MNSTMPQTVPMREILRNWKAVFAKTKKSKEPIIVLSNSKPQVALISLDLLEKMRLEKLAEEGMKAYRMGKTKSISADKEFEDYLLEIDKDAR